MMTMDGGYPSSMFPRFGFLEIPLPDCKIAVLYSPTASRSVLVGAIPARASLLHHRNKCARDRRTHMRSGVSCVGRVGGTGTVFVFRQVVKGR